MDNDRVHEESENTDRLKVKNEIRADRACIGCGFNLFGQPVTKEAHYGLAIARCPECGTVAAIQSYPTMSHWVNRFRAILAALWIVVLLGAFGISMMIIMGFSAGGVEIASDSLADVIGAKHAQWIDEQGQLALQAAQDAKNETGADQTKADDLVEGQSAGAGESGGESGVVIGAPIPIGAQINANPIVSTVTNTTNGVNTTVTTYADGTTSTVVNGVGVNNWGGYQWTQITPVWAKNHLDEAIAHVGGVWGNLDRSFMLLLLPSGVIALMMGVFWSVTMLGARRRTVVWVPMVAGIGAGAISLAIQMNIGISVWASEYAKSMAAPMVVPIIIGFQVIIALVGVVLGRKIARLVVLMTLPPRGRVSLSMLWTRDGLEMPSTRMR
ncbi:MAG: hypothetical protein ACWA5W_01265 [Phycisphaerales bacterium]